MSCANETLEPRRTFSLERMLHKRSAAMTNLRRVLEDEEGEDERRVVHHQLQAEWAEQRGQLCTSEPLTLTE